MLSLSGNNKENVLFTILKLLMEIYSLYNLPFNKNELFYYIINKLL